MPVQRPATKAKIYFDGKEQPNARALVVRLGSGSVLPSAELEIESIARGRGRLELADMSLAKLPQPVVEITLGDEIIFRGRPKARHCVLTASGDSIRVICRNEDNHLGEPLRQAWFFDGKSNGPIGLDLPTVFNPEDADGVIQPNRSAKLDPETKRSLFIHPESARTEAARKYAGSPSVQPWTLIHAVHYVCWTLNPAQTNVKNPTVAELQQVLPADSSLLRNHELKIGEYLPAQLNSLLQPLGYGWTLDFRNNGECFIRIFARATGTPVDLKLQAPGETIDVAKSNLESLALTADATTGVFNSIQVVGDFKRFESTFELKRAWPAEYDSRSMDDLTIDSDQWKETPALERVWRDWVLNEGGDYNGLRDGIDKPYDFDPLFGKREWIVRRRKFLPCLTKQNDGSPHGHSAGVFIEWWDGSEWRPVTELGSESSSIVVLDRECGIRFNGHEIPWLIRALGDNAKVRVTATVESDTRVSAKLSRPDLAFTDQSIDLVLNVGSKFKFEQRTANSALKEFSSDTADDEEFSSDDTEAAYGLAQHLVGHWTDASIGGTVVLTGLDYGYRGVIGQTISGINGRKVTFQTSPSQGHYPTVIGAVLDFQQQQLVLQLDSFRDERGVSFI